MKLNSFLMLAAIVAAVFGLAFLLAPSQLVALYGVKLTPGAEVSRPYRRLGDLGLRNRVLGRPQRQRGGNVQGRDDGGPDGRRLLRRSDPAARDGDQYFELARLAPGPDQRRAGDRLLVFCLRQGRRTSI